jgi:DNA topoisomerase-1
MEELGIGRPSTYAPTISTVQERGYVVKEDRPGTPREYKEITLAGKLEVKTKVENSGVEKKKLFPNDIGMVVNDFLNKHFPEIVDFNFTANVEQDFDQIAEGYIEWSKMIDEFYQSFHNKVEETLEKSGKSTGERILGKDPKSGRQVAVKIGPYGPMVQIGTKEEEEKPKFASLQRGQHLETITLEEALKLFDLPRNLGKYEDEEVLVSIGRFGPYVKHKGKYASLKKGVDDPFKITLDRAIELIEEKRERDRKKTIKTFPEDPDLNILRGRFGPYISYKKSNYRIPKGSDPEKISLEECYEIIKKKDEKDKTSKKSSTAKKNSKSKTGSKKSTGKKSTGTTKKTGAKGKSTTKKSTTKKSATKKSATKKPANKGTKTNKSKS